MGRTWTGGKKVSQAKYRAKNRLRLNADKRKSYKENPIKEKARSYKYYKNNKKKIHAHGAAWARKKRAEYKALIIEGYGGGCSCCGETEPLFLEIHHPEGDGQKDRKKYGGNTLGFYKSIIKKKFPKGYDLVCSNCHVGIHRSEDGTCPHKREKGKKKKP